MKRRRLVGPIVVVCLIVAALGVVLWPAPDPLRGARTVFLDSGGAQTTPGGSELEEGLNFVLNDRDLVLVADRQQADAVVRIESVTVNLGDVSVSFSQGGVSGRLRAVCQVTNLHDGTTHPMDLTVTLQEGRLAASLTGRKFWQVWK